MQSITRNFQLELKRPLMFLLGKRVNRANNAHRNTRGFTLIELLLAIAIVAVLATMTLSVMRSSIEDAKAAATQSTIQRIGSMLQLEMEQYEVRRLPVARSKINAAVGTGGNKFGKAEQLRQRVLADILCAEMPRPYRLNPGVEPAKYAPCSNCYGAFNKSITDYPVNEDLATNYTGLQLSSAKSAAMIRWASIYNKYPPSDPLKSFDLPAEYLYEILRGIDVDGVSGLEGLGNNSVGDSDEDGIPEVVDAWGQPLLFDIQQLETVSKTFGEYIDGNQFIGFDTDIPRSLEKIRFVLGSSKLN